MFSESYSNVGWNKGTGARSTEPTGPLKITATDTRAHPRHARGAASGRRHRAALHERVRAARRDDPLGAVHRPAREPRDAGACSRAIRTRARWRRRRPRSSSRRFTPPAFFARNRSRSSAWRRRSSRSTAARCRPTWTRSSSCRASAARPRTSSSATRSACRGCRSIGTCCAWRTASASPSPTIPRSSSSSCAPRCRRQRWTRTSDTLILHGRRICQPKPLCDQCAVRDDCDYYRDACVARRTRAAQKAYEHSPVDRAAFEHLVADALAVHSAPLPRRDGEPRHRRRGRAVARAAARDGRSSRPTRCSASTRARR